MTVLFRYFDYHYYLEKLGCSSNILKSTGMPLFPFGFSPFFGNFLVFWLHWIIFKIISLHVLSELIHYKLLLRYVIQFLYHNLTLLNQCVTFDTCRQSYTYNNTRDGVEYLNIAESQKLIFTKCFTKPICKKKSSRKIFTRLIPKNKSLRNA